MVQHSISCYIYLQLGTTAVAPLPARQPNARHLSWFSSIPLNCELFVKLPLNEVFHFYSHKDHVILPPLWGRGSLETRPIKIRIFIGLDSRLTVTTSSLRTLTMAPPLHCFEAAGIQETSSSTKSSK